MDTGHRFHRSEDGPVVSGHVTEAVLPSAGSRIEAVPGYRMPVITRGEETALPGTRPWVPVWGPGPVDADWGSRHAVNVIGRHARVFGDDDRVRVPNVLEEPWRAICALRITTATGLTRHGTGWFIDPQTVVTAGHCVFMHAEDGWVRSIEVIPALTRNQRPFGAAVGTRFRAVDGWIKDHSKDYDYGVILLDEDLGSRPGSIQVATLDEAELTRSIAQIAGYPVDREAGTAMYFHAREIRAASAFRVSYEIDTYGGQSGSPVWITRQNGERLAVAIHTTGGETSNTATRITSEVVENLNRWRSEPREESAPAPRREPREPAPRRLPAKGRAKKGGR